MKLEELAVRYWPPQDSEVENLCHFIPGKIDASARSCCPPHRRSSTSTLSPSVCKRTRPAIIQAISAQDNRLVGMHTSHSSKNESTVSCETPKPTFQQLP